MMSVRRGHRGSIGSEVASMGKSPTPVQPRLQKYSGSLLTQITCISLAIPSHTEGRLAIVTDAGRDAVDVRWRVDEGAYLADGKVVWS
jgi:hypothetical protein